MENTLESLLGKSRGNFVNLSRATVLPQTRDSGEVENTLDLMMGTNRYADEKTCSDLGIVPEPEAEIDLSPDNLEDILRDYSAVANRFNLEQFFRQDVEEEEDVTRATEVVVEDI